MFGAFPGAIGGMRHASRMLDQGFGIAKANAR